MDQNSFSPKTNSLSSNPTKIHNKIYIDRRCKHMGRKYWQINILISKVPIEIYIEVQQVKCTTNNITEMQSNQVLSTTWTIGKFQVMLNPESKFVFSLFISWAVIYTTSGPISWLVPPSFCFEI